MHVGELINLERITVSLAVDTRRDALQALASSFARDCRIDPESVRRAFEEREARGSTNVGVGVAIPHARIPGVEGTKVAVAVCPEGLCYDGEGGEPVRILVALLTEASDPHSSLEALSSVVRSLRCEEVRNRMCQARSADEVLDALLSA